MFPVITVPPDAANLPEQVGSKRKFWYEDKLKLFKFVLGETGEDWSEKMACELCRLLGIPHAHYELGLWNGQRGVVSETFVPPEGRLILGNELLARIVEDYPAKKSFRVHQHTVGRVLAILRAVLPPLGFEPFADVKTAQDVFVGYLMLDTWIANQDRHHENWGLVLTKERPVHLAPSFDHASCLGRNETDEVRHDRLTTKDKNRSMEHYVERACSAFYASERDRNPLSTLDSFLYAAKFRPRAALSWLKQLESVSPQGTEILFHEIGNDRISPVAIDFSQKMLTLNRSRLLNCVEALLK